MKMNRAVLLVLPIAALVTVASHVQAQYRYPAPSPYGGTPGMALPGMPPSQMPGPVQPAAYPPQMQVPMPQAGPYGVIQTQATMPAGDYGYGGYAEAGAAPSSHPLAPYAAGGFCHPRWYDIKFELFGLDRSNNFSTRNLSSDGPAGFAPPIIALNTDVIDPGLEVGVDITLAMQIGAGSALELGFQGLVNWSDSALVPSPMDDLFSVFSGFGVSPPAQTVSTPINGEYNLEFPVRAGFPQVDSAELHVLDYSGSFDTIGLDYRKRWVSPNCRVHGSWLVGVRYFQLEEAMRFRSFVNYDVPLSVVPSVANPVGPPPLVPPTDTVQGSLNYLVGVNNSMTGARFGGDLWLNIVPGLRIGNETTVGIYGNHATSLTTINATTSLPDGTVTSSTVIERNDSDQFTFILETGLSGLYRIGPNVTLRGGYRVMLIQDVALAPENFNPDPTFFGGVARAPFFDDGGTAFFHGFSGGIEWMW